jgi:hypothetical protein
MLILIGLLMMAIGILMVVFRRQIYNFTGYIDFVEGWFPGGTNSFILFFGLALILVGILFIVGIGGSLLQPIGNSLKGSFGSTK